MAEPDWVEVAYASPDRPEVRRIPHQPGITAAAAVLAAFGSDLPVEAGAGELDLGVWGRPVARDHALSPGDRVEIYRPLMFDPREERRRRAGVSRRRAAS